jgi:molybdenum cofactor cytidylyltransferase
VLAAGSSSRMKGIKQLLPWKGTNLIGHALNEAEHSAAHSCFVVLGSKANEIKDTLQTQRTEIIVNTNWSYGLGTSIAAAMKHLENMEQHYDGVLLALADQPLITSEHYNNLIKRFLEREKAIIATGYPRNMGVPALFGQKYFASLKALAADQGAKWVIRNNPHDMEQVFFEWAAVDIDTPENYQERYEKFGK